MGSVLFQFFNLILIIALFTVPIVITILLLRHFGKSKNMGENEDYLLQKIRELERRIDELENKY
ncbi:hypothetical protein [Natronincola ferrireducens]|uniref:Uncharacterized protein n=1 Tax=Natronincola ferrireducens TaxID=393762 RepID=A0A1G8YJ01_9FIRM|nr:hypothetical protein [Natronincola ferrireducens]SDK02726.1 hypothetical protein SAMN05660472_00556 [Natronincola ferrireducens]